MKTITVNKKDLKHDLSVFPNFSSSGSVKGMKKLYYGLNALLIKSGGYIYKVSEEVYNFYLQFFLRPINNKNIEIMENYTITEKGNNYLINGVLIPNEIFEEEKTDFKIIERESFIDDLIDWISEAKGNDKILMKEDLKLMISIDDKYILSSIETNYYLYGNSEEYNEKCKEILELIN